ncbi:hypothetical protein LCGC14_3139100, partial [marine sediment metagenome]
MPPLEPSQIDYLNGLCYNYSMMNTKTCVTCQNRPVDTLHGQYCGSCRLRSYREKRAVRKPRRQRQGPRYLTKGGYALVWIEEDQTYQPEHRLVMARHLKRCLLPWELVHHKGVRVKGIKN